MFQRAYSAFSILLAISLMAAQPGAAQAPDGFEVFYDEDTNVNLGGRWVVADISLWADPNATANGDLNVALVTDVTKFIEETEQDLENWIAARQDECGERWRAGDPLIAFPPDAIRFALDLEVELWNCGWNGKGKPRRYAREGGTVDVTLEPFVEDGKLQARLEAFSIEDQRGLTKYLPLEFFVRRALTSEIKKLNENRKFYRAPQPLFDAGFTYESIRAEKRDDDHVIITVHYVGNGDGDDLAALAISVREDGITQ